VTTAYVIFLVSLVILCLDSIELIQSNKLKAINTCDEQGAAFAADTYARINGLGVVCVTYCVGGLKVVNATAQAFAEKSPLVVYLAHQE
jgi:TPP-dependent 2-oxoacid decarboxylase